MVFEFLKIVVATGVLSLAIRFFWRHRTSTALKLLFCLFYSRFVFAAFHQFTYPALFGSMSLISLASLASVGLCMVMLPMVKPRNHTGLVILKSLLPVYGLIALMMVSSVANGDLKAALPSLIKWVYLLQLITLLGYVISLDGVRTTLKVLLMAYGFPVVMLVLSILLGVSKRNELDSSSSYVGGFFHEAVFSTVVFSAAFFAFTYARKFSVSKSLSSLGVLVGSFLLLMMVNYRTAMLAFLALCGVLAFTGFRSAGMHKKVVLTTGMLCLGLWSTSVDFALPGERFADLPNAFNNASDLVTYPENYSRDDRRLFSGRLYMWSAYISEANAGSVPQILFGRGMDSWKGYFEKYAHNTFVSLYFELGLVGLILCLSIFFGVFYRLRKIPDPDLRTCCQAFLAGFFIMNLGTMPLWSMEGIYCLAVLIALSRNTPQRVSARRSMVTAPC